MQRDTLQVIECMKLSEIHQKLKETERLLSEALHGFSASETAALGEKGLEKLIDEARDIKSAGEDIKHYGERIKEHLKTFRSAAKKFDQEAEKE